LSFTSDLAAALAEDVLERFQRYVRIDTQSAYVHDGTPSTPGQLDLGRLLVEELQALGVEDAELDEHGYVYASLPGNVDGAPPIGLLAHVDTVPDTPGAGVEPIVHREYDGRVIELPKNGTRLDPEEMPELRDAVGHDIVTSSGDTLLGADDKAGVAAIMTAVKHLVEHPDLPRPPLRIGFTPDEEIGEGPKLFDIDRFGARCAYTVDASALGELEDETFSAAEMTLTFHGVEVHPGTAKDKLINALRLAGKTIAALPASLSPEQTEERQGFIHPYRLNGDGGRAELVSIVRDFDDDLLQQHLAVLRSTAEEVVAAAPGARLEVASHVQYPNMRRFLEPYPAVMDAAQAALAAEGIEPVRKPIRGGTDGAQLSERGLPTPNLFDGGHEYHSPREWASVQEMAASAAVLVRLAESWTKEPYRSAFA
jgi:tripeptide aminopeptidase